MNAQKKYVEFYFSACFEEMMAGEQSTWPTNLSGNEIIELAQSLEIRLNVDEIITNYRDRANQAIDIYHSKKDEMLFMYFDLRRSRTDQNDMFFFGLRCYHEDRTRIMRNLISIYEQINTSGPFHYQMRPWVLYNRTRGYLNQTDAEYTSPGILIHHKEDAY
ncbi:MAG: hypothetical protein AAF487_07215 [Bacteroidota bacterium]